MCICAVFNAAGADVWGMILPEHTSYRGRHVIELALPDDHWQQVLSLTYSVEPDLSLEKGTFTFSLTSAGDTNVTGAFTLTLTNDPGTWTINMIATGHAVSAPYHLTEGPGASLIARLNYEKSEQPDLIIPLAFGDTPLGSALDQKRLSFVWRYRPLRSTDQSEAALRSRPALLLHGYRDSQTGAETPASRVPPIALSERRIATAFDVAKATGHFDPAVFPNVHTGNDAAGRAATIKVMADLDRSVVTAKLKAGYQLTIYRATNGAFTYRFIATPQASEPRLLLVEHYQLSSFPARYGYGRTIKTFSLLPGERTTIKLSTYKRSSESMQRATSVLDSASDETESKFERTVMSEQSDQSNTSSSFEYHAEAEAEGKANWGWGSAEAKVSGGVKGSSTSSRENLAKNVASAAAHNAARASSHREVHVDTSMDVKLETGEEEAVERVLQNINVSRTLNFVFRQMNQEFVTLLHLVDIRVAYFDGNRESRDEVPLSEVDTLLRRCVHPDHFGDVRDLIRTELAEFMEPASDFIKTRKLPSGAQYLRINPNHTSTHHAGEIPIEVPGVIVAADTHVMRTDGIAVESFLGRGEGLDTYSAALQTQAIREREADNRLKNLQADRLVLANKIIADGDTAKAALFQQLYPRAQVINQIEQAAVSAPNGHFDIESSDLTTETTA